MRRAALAWRHHQLPRHQTGEPRSLPPSSDADRFTLPVGSSSFLPVICCVLCLPDPCFTSVISLPFRNPLSRISAHSSTQTKFVLTTESVVRACGYRVREAARLSVPLLHASFAAAYLEGAVTSLAPWLIPVPVRACCARVHVCECAWVWVVCVCVLYIVSV